MPLSTQTEALYLFCGFPIVKNIFVHITAISTVICGAVSLFLNVLILNYFDYPRVGSFWLAIPCIMSTFILFWAKNNYTVKVSTVIGITSIAVCVYGCFLDISHANKVFALAVCQNTKGGIYGDLTLQSAVSTNLQLCRAPLSTGQYDLCCTTAEGLGDVVLFDGSNDGDDVLSSYTQLLTASVVFELYITITTFILTIVCAIGISGRFLFPPQIHIDETESEIPLWKRELMFRGT